MRRPKNHFIHHASRRSDSQVEMALGRQTLAETEFAIIEKVMKLCGQNKSLAAQKLGLTRFALDRRLKKIADELE